MLTEDDALMNEQSEKELSAEEEGRSASVKNANVEKEIVEEPAETTVADDAREGESEAEELPVAEENRSVGDVNSDGSSGEAVEATAVAGDVKPATEEIPVECCRNCGEKLEGKYCHHCGQKVAHHHDYSVKAFVGHAFHHLTHFDFKVFRTLPAVIFRPGLVTYDYLTGRQASYVGPVQLFIIANLLFFLLKAGGLFHYTLEMYRGNATTAALIDESIARLGVGSEVYRAMFDTSMHFQQKSYIIILIPVFALLMKLLYARSKRYYVEHLIFSFHFFSFYLLFLLVIPIILYTIDAVVSLFGASLRGDDVAIFAVIMPVTALYLAIALKRVYGQSYLVSSLKGIALSVSILPLILLYQILLFYIVWNAL